MAELILNSTILLRNKFYLVKPISIVGYIIVHHGGKSKWTLRVDNNFMVCNQSMHNYMHKLPLYGSVSYCLLFTVMTELSIIKV